MRAKQLALGFAPPATPPAPGHEPLAAGQTRDVLLQGWHVALLVSFNPMASWRRRVRRRVRQDDQGRFWISFAGARIEVRQDRGGWVRSGPLLSVEAVTLERRERIAGVSAVARSLQWRGR